MNRFAEWPLRLITAAGLAYDAYVHADLAGSRDSIGRHLTQGDLFRVEAGAAAAAALLVILVGRWIGFTLAFLVAASAFGAVMLYRYVDVGSLGPLPNMYEPVWYGEKTRSAWAEGLAVVTSAMGLALAAYTMKRRPVLPTTARRSRAPLR